MPQAVAAESAVPDALAGRIIRERMAPAFRNGDYYTGLDEAASALMAAIDGEPLPAPDAPAEPGQLDGGAVLLSLGLAVLAGMASASRKVTWKLWLPLAVLPGVIYAVATRQHPGIILALSMPSVFAWGLGFALWRFSVARKIVGGIALIVLGFMNSLIGIIVAWTLIQVAYNFAQGPLSAVLPDRVPVARRGTFAALSGIGLMLGALGGQIVGSQLAHTITLGYVIFAAFAVVVLFYCWGPRDLDADIDAVLQAPDSDRRLAAAQALRADGAAAPLPFESAPLVEATFAAALSRWFGVLFWFVVLGPAGALGYRIVQLLARHPGFADHIDANQGELLERTARILDWAPAHLVALTLALVSDFDAVIKTWRDYHAAHGKGYFTLDLGFLGAIAKAGIDADVEAGDGYASDVSNPLVELADAQRVLRRILVGWLALIALVALIVLTH